MEGVVLEEKKYLWLNFSEQTLVKSSLTLRLLYIKVLNVKVKR